MITTPQKKSRAEILDKPPSTKPESEIYVLGAIINKPEIFPEVKARIRVADFWNQAHQAVFACFDALHSEGKPIEAALYFPRLRERQDELGDTASAMLHEIGRGAPPRKLAVSCR